MSVHDESGTPRGRAASAVGGRGCARGMLALVASACGGGDVQRIRWRRVDRRCGYARSGRRSRLRPRGRELRGLVPTREPAGGLGHHGRPGHLRHADGARRGWRVRAVPGRVGGAQRGLHRSGRSPCATASPSTTAPRSTATVVKNNIDAWRGEYPARNPLLLRFAYEQHLRGGRRRRPDPDDHDHDVRGRRFPSYLYYQGRVGIMGQAQLDDAGHCDENLIGTGPFVKEEWVVNDHFTASRERRLLAHRRRRQPAAVPRLGRVPPVPRGRLTGQRTVVGPARGDPRHRVRTQIDRPRGRGRRGRDHRRGSRVSTPRCPTACSTRPSHRSTTRSPARPSPRRSIWTSSRR